MPHHNVDSHVSALTMEPSLQQVTTPNVYRVAVLGPESTGKTTLCQDLAAYFESKWVTEYMRPYLQQKWDTEHKTCEWQDLLPIAQGQIALENQTAQQMTNANQRYLFCDTTLFELMVYAYWYYGECPIEIESAAIENHYELIVLTEVDVVWEPDDLRDAPHQREDIRDAFVAALNQHNKPFKSISGDRESRVKKVANWLGI